jgi:hypothetical protein
MGFDKFGQNEQDPPYHRHGLGIAQTGDLKELGDQWREWITKAKGEREG